MLTGAACLGLFVSGCGSGPSCGCGAPTDAPLSQHNLAYAGDHTVVARCVCRCGSAAPTAFPADRPCEDYETVCQETSGNRVYLRCN